MRPDHYARVLRHPCYRPTFTNAQMVPPWHPMWHRFLDDMHVVADPLHHHPIETMADVRATWAEIRRVVTPEWLDYWRSVRSRPDEVMRPGAPISFPFEVRATLRRFTNGHGYAAAGDFQRNGRITKNFDDVEPWSLSGKPRAYFHGRRYDADLARRTVVVAVLEAITGRPVVWRSDGVPVIPATEPDVIRFAAQLVTAWIDAAVVRYVAKQMAAQRGVNVLTVANQRATALRFCHALRLPYPSIADHAGIEHFAA